MFHNGVKSLVDQFVSPSHFAKCYREQYNQVPKSTRLGAPRPASATAGVVAAE